MRQSKTTLKELTAAYRAVLRYGILCNAVALGLIAITTPASAITTKVYMAPGYVADGVDLATLYPDGVVSGENIGIYGVGQGQTNSFTGTNLDISGTDYGTWLYYHSLNIGDANTESISITGTGDTGVDANYGAALNIGSSMDTDVTINGGSWAGVSAYEYSDAYNPMGRGTTVSIQGDNVNISTDGSYGVIALNQTGARHAPTINITGHTVDISGATAAIHAGNGTVNTINPVSTVNITADQINLTATNGNGIGAMSQGIVNLVGNTTINAKNAVLTRGNAQTYINKSGDKTVVMDGDIDFDYDKATSGTSIDAIVDITLNGSNSIWTGNTVVSYDTKPTVDKLAVNNSMLTMKNGAIWNATLVEDNKGDTNGRYYTALNNLNIDNSTINIADTERGIYVDNLIANNATITGGKMTVNKTADTINDRIDDYRSKIVLANGSSVRADAKLASEQIDMFDIDAGSNITVAGLNILEDFDGTKTLSLGNAGNIAASGNVFTSLYQYDITGSNNGTLTIAKTGTGGVAAAAGSTTDGARENVAYTVTDDDQSVTGAAIIRNADMTIVGQGTETSDNSITLADNLTVGANDADTSTLAIENAKFTGTGALVNEKNATLNIKDSLMGVRITNRGTLISDPTTYSSTVDNSGYASFDNDTFASTAVLANTGVVDLKDVVFQSGAVISGNGRTNLVAGTTSFNNTMNANSLTLASGANFNGTVNGGSLDTRNGGIDSVSGSINNANLYVDASLRGNGSMDSFAGTSGSSIKNINIIDSEYGTNSSLSIATGGATLADGYTITGGTNYYTDVKQDGSNIVFSDKLVNNSGMHAQLGDWGGHYIGTSNTYDDTNTNSYTTTGGATVGYALEALDDRIWTLNGDADTVGSVKNTVRNEAENATFTADTTPAASLNGATTIGSAINNVANAVDTINTTLSGYGDIVTHNVSEFQTALDANNKLSTDYIDWSDAQTAALTSGIDSTKVAQIATNAGDIATLKGGANQSGSVAHSIKNQAENATFTANTTPAASLNGATTIGSAINNVANAVDTLNAGADVAGSVDNKVAAATTMKIANVTNPDGDEVKPFQNFDNDTSVVNAVAALDRHMGTVHGLVGAADATETTTNREYHGNLAIGTTVEDHLLALDSSIGDMRDFNTTNTYATSTDSVAMNLKALDKAIADQSSLALVSANAYTDERIDKLDKDLSAGIASAVALSSVATTGVQKGEVAVSGGYGYYNGQSAAAFGAAMGLTNRWSVNAGAGLSNADVSFRAGTSYKFKLF